MNHFIYESAKSGEKRSRFVCFIWFTVRDVSPQTQKTSTPTSTATTTTTTKHKLAQTTPSISSMRFIWERCERVVRSESQSIAHRMPECYFPTINERAKQKIECFSIFLCRWVEVAVVAFVSLRCCCCWFTVNSLEISFNLFRRYLHRRRFFSLHIRYTYDITCARLSAHTETSQYTRRYTLRSGLPSV